METTSAEMAKRRKFEEPARIKDKDRLSSLPDEIISHILSFLQTKYAVGTVVLSRRWKDQWTGVSTLDFDNRLLFTAECFKPEQVKRRGLEFFRFVDRVMSRHENLDSLTRFRFSTTVRYFDQPVSPYFWSRMQSAVSGPELEEIDISSSETRMPFCVHCWLLPTLKNLKILKLQQVMIEITNVAITEGFVILLPSLKMLQLWGVEIMRCEPLNRLISGCPVLETLHVQECSNSFIRREDVLDIVSLPSLRSMTIINAGLLHHMVIEAPSLELLHLELGESQFLGNISSGGGSPVFPCLDSAHVDVGFDRIDDEDDEHWQMIIGFLSQISNAREIYLYGNILSGLSDPSDIQQLPVFPKLTSLTVEAGASIHALHWLLNSASKLQSLSVVLERLGRERAMGWEEEEEEESSEEVSDADDDASTPECLLSSLEEIDIQFYREIDQDDMEMVAYLLKTGAVLKKVNLHSDNFPGEKNRADVASLLKLPRGSTDCEAHFYFTDYMKGIHPDISWQAVISHQSKLG